MRRGLKAIVALLSLVGFFAGSAIGLMALAGAPIPKWTALRLAVEVRYFPPHLVAQLAACLAWPALTYLLVAVVRMGVDAWKDRPTHASRPVRWLQPVVRHAIAALVLFSGLLSRNPAWAAPARGSAAIATSISFRPASLSEPMIVGVSPESGHAAPTATYLVKPRDELWDIARTQLGDPFRWRAIWDLNKGRNMVDLDGRQQSFDDPRLIVPGWELVLPARSDVPRAAPPPSVPPVPMATTPPATAESPSPVPPPTMVAIASAADRGAPTAAPSLATFAEAGVLATAVLSVLRVLRRRQAQHRPAGRRIRLPSRTATTTELVLRKSEAPDRVVLVQKAMAWLGHSLRGLPNLPAIQGLVVDDHAVEVLIDQPVAPPAPWSAAAAGFRWRVVDTDLGGDPPDAPILLPSLVSFGRVAAGDADVLMNLEAGGLISVRGDPAQAAGFLFSLATQLVGTPWAQAVNLVLVALPPGLAARDNVRQVSSVSEIAAELRATAEVMQAAAQQRGCRDVLEGRVRGQAGDGWPPVVVLCGHQPSADELRFLATVTRPGHGVAAVVANAGTVGRWEVDVGTSPCPVHPLRIAIEPGVLDASAMAAIAELIQTAEDDAGVTVEAAPYDQIEVSVERPRPAGANGTVRARITNGSGPEVPELGDPPILVRVLGSVEIDGSQEFKRAKSRELVVYLAMHPNGVGEAELDEALWGSATGRVVLSSTRDSTVSVARTSLGGAARLLPAQGQGREKRYQLGPDVQSDWSQFCALHRFARQHDSAVAVRRALELVRGRPFEAVMSGRTYGWIHTEGHGRHIEAEVADAADLAARLYLEAGDPIGARWAARRGLLAEPYTERLWVRLMEAADALGESQEIERIMDEMDIVLELDGDFTGLHPNTLAVYDRLSRRHRFPAGT